jgi:hypothetical protein
MTLPIINVTASTFANLSMPKTGKSYYPDRAENNQGALILYIHQTFLP